MPITIFTLYSLLIALITIDGAHIGLFASTGCYSHDVMMRKFADRLSSREGGAHQVTLIQIRVYEFDRALPSERTTSRSPWEHLSYEASSNESVQTLRRLQRQMWLTLVPYDANAVSVEGVSILTTLHKHHIEACDKALRDGAFMEKAKKLRLDLLVTDYVLNECALRFRRVLNVNLAYLSNYPVLSSYAVDLGISSTPSYVPSVIGYESPNMPFHKRVFNSLLYFLLWSTRQWFDYDANQTFKRVLGHRVFKKSRSKGLRSVLTFSTPFELMMDTPRPLARNLHYFGCDHCFDAESDGMVRNASELLNITPRADGIILVTFGTVTKGDQVPIVQLQRLIRTFAKFSSFTFVWQLDVSSEYFRKRVLDPIDFPMPSNVHLFPWIPLKQLMRDQRVVLSINHGGISTCSEAVHHGVPILGVALQGDQGYNLARMVDKGVAEMLPVSRLTEEAMREKLHMMIQDMHRYKASAWRLRSMVHDYKSLYKGITPSAFWVGWTARHFGEGRNASSAAIRAKRFLTLRYPTNWFLYYSADVMLVFSVIALMTVWIALILHRAIVPLLSKRVRIRIGSSGSTKGKEC